MAIWSISSKAEPELEVWGNYQIFKRSGDSIIRLAGLLTLFCDRKFQQSRKWLDRPTCCLRCAWRMQKSKLLQKLWRASRGIYRIWYKKWTLILYILHILKTAELDTVVATILTWQQTSLGSPIRYTIITNQCQLNQDYFYCNNNSNRNVQVWMYFPLPSLYLSVKQRWTCLRYLLKIVSWNGLQLYLSDHCIDNDPSSLLQGHFLFPLLFFLRYFDLHHQVLLWIWEVGKGFLHVW